MTHLILIAEDFDDLQTPFTNDVDTCNPQYMRHKDCPIARAAKRIGLFEKPLVSIFNITEGASIDFKSINIEGRVEDVERCRLDILAGEEARIEITSKWI